MSPDRRPTPVRVVVVGAGYAGLIATNRFLGSLTAAERERVQLTVVNPRDQFVERIRLHQLAAGDRTTVSRPLAELLHQDADVLVGRVERIDPRRRVVRLTAGGEAHDLSWDHLVYAVGSTAAAHVPGARDHAFLLADLEGAERAAAALRAAGPGARVTVLGGGFTGVETATEIAAARPDLRVSLWCGGLLVPSMRAAARRSIQRSLTRLGVTVRERTHVAALEEGKAVLADGSVEAFDACIVATSFAVPGLAGDSGLPVDGEGRLRVDAALCVPGVPGIVGAGDAVVVDDPVGDHLRMGCAVALPLGAAAAQTLLARIRGEVPPAISVGFAIQCVSLGRKDGYVQLVRADDTPRPLHIGGRLGAVVKEQVCRMVVDRPAAERERPGAYSWPKGPRTGASR